MRQFFNPIYKEEKMWSFVPLEAKFSNYAQTITLNNICPIFTWQDKNVLSSLPNPIPFLPTTLSSLIHQFQIYLSLSLSPISSAFKWAPLFHRQPASRPAVTGASVSERAASLSLSRVAASSLLLLSRWRRARIPDL